MNERLNRFECRHVAPCSALQKCAERIAGHIEKPLDIRSIVAEIESDEYSAELMLQHLLLWAAKTERHHDL